MENLISLRGCPGNIRCDNGPEFISHRLQDWCERKKITFNTFNPGEPTQNAYIERDNGSLRRELLNAYLFTTLKEVRLMAREWQTDYNCDRPHKSLKYKTPATYYDQWLHSDMRHNAGDEALSTSAGGDPSSL